MPSEHVIRAERRSAGSTADPPAVSAAAPVTEEKLANQELIQEVYQGIRPAPGYPACPEHSQKDTLFKLLGASEACDMKLTEHYAMWPAASVCGWLFAHPKARYFGVGKIGKDQVIDYAHRKGVDLQAMEQLLKPNLGYTSGVNEG